MKIAIPANAPELDAVVEKRLGTAAYLLVVDLDDMSFEAVAGPSPSAGPGAGIEAVSIVLNMGAKAILSGFISPYIASTLEKNGIAVITPVGGRVTDVIEKYKQGAFVQPSSLKMAPARAIPPLRPAFQKAARQFISILPFLTGVVLLVGLFRGFVSRELLMTIFSGHVIQDTLWGACLGSIFTGNPANSYVVGETLLNMGASLFGAAALMMTWVNVGVLQLPAEISALGARFAIVRLVAAFLMAIFVSILTVVLTGGHL
jgi:predicted Fe-Mo cluster-binding NifX family protein